MSKTGKQLLGAAIFFGLYMGLVLIANRPSTVVKPEDNTPTHWYSTPKYDTNRRPHHYDWQMRRWVYEDEVELIDRAKAIKNDNSQEQDLDEYLQRKVKGYKEDTYWGEEYDLEDPD